LVKSQWAVREQVFFQSAKVILGVSEMSIGLGAEKGPHPLVAIKVVTQTCSALQQAVSAWWSFQLPTKKFVVTQPMPNQERVKVRASNELVLCTFLIASKVQDESELEMCQSARCL
jgi:hypothetical protein